MDKNNKDLLEEVEVIRNEVIVVTIEYLESIKEDVINFMTSLVKRSC